MAISVTEYLGKRTDLDNAQIAPHSAENDICPFYGKRCEKIIKGLKPVCSIRNFGRKTELSQDEYNDYPIWIVCENRLCSTKTKNRNGTLSLTDYQKNILNQVANAVLGITVNPNDLYVKSEANVQVNEDRKQDMHADFVLTYCPNVEYTGKKKLIIEMQGGGETSNTGTLTKKVDDWEKSESPSNSVLRSLVSGVGILQTNAWRRQQEQALVKSNVAERTPNVDGFVLCIGDKLYDYLEPKLKLNNTNYEEGEDWKVTIVTFKENIQAPAVEGPLPLVVNRVIRYSTYNDFVSAITRQGKSSETAFEGKFISLTGIEREF